MTTETVTDADTLRDLDFEPRCRIAIYELRRFLWFEVASRTSEPCGKPAAWTTTCLHCHHTSLVCQEHYEVLAGVPVLTCMGCRTEGEPTEVFRFVPIGAL